MKKVAIFTGLQAVSAIDNAELADFFTNDTVVQGVMDGDPSLKTDEVKTQAHALTKIVEKVEGSTLNEIVKKHLKNQNQDGNLTMSAMSADIANEFINDFVALKQQYPHTKVGSREELSTQLKTFVENQSRHGKKWKNGLFCVSQDEMRARMGRKEQSKTGVRTTSITPTAENDDWKAKTWDWRDASKNGKNLKAVTTVKDQASCGSCWSFATAAVIEGTNVVQNGNPSYTGSATEDRDENDKESMSEEQIIDNISPFMMGCRGGNVADGIAFVAGGKKGESMYSEDWPFNKNINDEKNPREFGLCSYNSYPYTSGPKNCETVTDDSTECVSDGDCKKTERCYSVKHEKKKRCAVPCWQPNHDKMGWKRSSDGKNKFVAHKSTCDILFNSTTFAPGDEQSNVVGKLPTSQSINKTDATMFIKMALTKYGPLAMGGAIRNIDKWHAYSNTTGIGKVEDYWGIGFTDGGHAVTLVGWDQDESGKEYWIIKNSWATSWGNNGYLYLETGVRDDIITVNEVNWAITRTHAQDPLLCATNDECRTTGDEFGKKICDWTPSATELQCNQCDASTHTCKKQHATCLRHEDCYKNFEYSGYFCDTTHSVCKKGAEPSYCGAGDPCKSGWQCDSKSNLCYPSGGKPVPECEHDWECDGDNEQCNIQTGKCEKKGGGDACKVDDDCDADQKCEGGSCVPNHHPKTNKCKFDFDCTDPDKPYCNTHTHECQATDPHPDPTPCSSDHDCKGSKKPYCNTDSGKCQKNPFKPDPTTCSDNTDCPSATPYCNKDTSTCQATKPDPDPSPAGDGCIWNTDCKDPSKPVCSQDNWKCRALKTDECISGDSDKPKLMPSQCSKSKPVCDWNKCVAVNNLQCFEDSDCSALGKYTCSEQTLKCVPASDHHDDDDQVDFKPCTDISQGINSANFSTNLKDCFTAGAKYLASALA